MGLDLPLLSDNTLVFGTIFFVKDFQVDDVAACFEEFYDIDVDGNMVGVLLGLERGL